MEDLPQQNCQKYDHHVARVVWAAYILSYLTKARSHIGLPNHDPAEEEDRLERGNAGAGTERATVLGGSRESIRSKFLDCIAQLLSPSKGWHNVTATALREHEDFVEIDVARNDSFGMARCDVQGHYLSEPAAFDVDYRRKLEDYLRSSVPEDDFEGPTISASRFEFVAIEYTGRRIDHWTDQVRRMLGYASRRHNWDIQQWSKHQLAINVWTSLTKLLHQNNIETAQFRQEIVQRAHECIISAEVYELLQMTFEAKVGSKIWNALKFLARPIMDCRMLRCIAGKHTQFRDVRIHLVPLKQMVALRPEYQIDICSAWAQLTPISPQASEMRMIAQFTQQFKRNCASSHAMHAEMQLFMHHGDNVALCPSLNYFGCSKKACLLCEAFLRSLPNPIATRGRHGVCYPAWGAPYPRVAGAEVALKQVENMLVCQIKTHFENLVLGTRKHLAIPTAQSTIVSDFSTLSIQSQLQREQMVESVTEAERARRSERLIFHKLLCKQFSVQPLRPSKAHKRAILFPADQSKPRMIWVHCELKSDEEHGDGAPYEMVDLYPHLGADKPNTGTLRIEYNPIRDRNFGCGMVYWAPRKEGYSITLYFREAFLMDGSSVNRSILTSVGTSGVVHHQICGPVVAMQETPLELHRDITLSDMRHIIDYLISYGTTETREWANHSKTNLGTSILGVKICCYGEIKLHNSETYIAVEVPKGHPTRLMYRQGKVSPISKILGMPLILRKFDDIDVWIDPLGWDKNTMTADSNQDATFLMLETDPEKPDWGWAPPYWNAQLGNVLAVRADDQNLDVEDLRMMCSFARRKLGPMFEDALGGGHKLRTKQEVLDFITWDNMVEFSNRQAPGQAGS
ncbi:hypothetical protein ACJA88_014832 [Fusarium oxysporum]